MRILILEDNPQMAETIALTLEEEGYQVSTATSVRPRIECRMRRSPCRGSGAPAPDVTHHTRTARRYQWGCTMRARYRCRPRG